MAGTVGHKLMSGKPTKIDLDKDTQIDVQCQASIYLTLCCCVFLLNIIIRLLESLILSFP